LPPPVVVIKNLRPVKPKYRALSAGKASSPPDGSTGIHP